MINTDKKYNYFNKLCFTKNTITTNKIMYSTNLPTLKLTSYKIKLILFVTYI
jgi:hypothetical protein